MFLTQESLLDFRNDGSQSCNRARASLITQAVDSSSSSFSSFAVSETESPCTSGGSKFLPYPQRSQIRPTAKKDSEQRQVRNGEEEEEGRSRSRRTRRRRGRREPGSDESPTTTTTTAFTRRHLFFGCFLSFSLMDHGRSSLAGNLFLANCRASISA